MRIVVVAGEPIVRRGFTAALESAADLNLVAECGDARSAFIAIDAQKPELVVMDLALSGMNGITATREVKRRAPATRVLLLSAVASERDAMESFAAGADGFALKTELVDDLLQAFRIVGNGGRYLTRSLQAPRRGGARRDADTSPSFDRDVLHALSPREREVLDLVLKGMRNRDIARELCVSIKTVDTHRTRINRKLGCAGSADLIRFAAKNGLLRTTRVASDGPGEATAFVLLVDDDRRLRDEMLRRMEAQGYQPIHATSVTSALEELAKRHVDALLVIDAKDHEPTVWPDAQPPP
jgi:two-component system, NarL family, response regulator NreC